MARNPRTGEKVEIPPHPDPYFRFSDMAHKQFNDRIKKDT
jgi:nucleoid DNA-binding protein